MSTAEARNDKAVKKSEFLLSVPGEILIPYTPACPGLESLRKHSGFNKRIGSDD